jgi:hypothetical protein
LKKEFNEKFKNSKLKPEEKKQILKALLKKELKKFEK